MSDRWQEIGVVGVDSGTITITDYVTHPTVQPKAWIEKLEQEGRLSEAPLIEQLNFVLGHAGAGMVVSTGMGDGVYPVYAKIGNVPGGWGVRVKEVKVVFID